MEKIAPPIRQATMVVKKAMRAFCYELLYSLETIRFTVRSSLSNSKSLALPSFAEIKKAQAKTVTVPHPDV
ncbi:MULTISPECIES: hypothetical protein [Brevibacillus]|jgi:hypothetical protein|uniref:hypothetical protein n=1 Tax=Brevibacillus TaxID=55080 RepID=UPI0009DFD853|nr:hypothetical protein [Brevibacillus borstelensis]MBE5393767.1 hypothetical protein [Brevibacillus borstelensis]MCC0566131.1 hypothetical protein [Brevibacillus borstelensis]MCM3472445.1 hypothetical protein [Brevibacillus borstelensis]MCM3560728.1 hypothetical protein [Brevibacillus borstelensis]MCM3592675.1 hypothetical protein [Brevibacillus borstelensis]